MNEPSIDILRDKVRTNYAKRFIDGNPDMTIKELTSMTPLKLVDSIKRVFGPLSAPAFSVVAGDLAITLHRMGYKFAFEKE